MTNKEFKTFLKSKGVTYRELSDLVNVKYTSIRSQLSKDKPLPRWAKAFVEGYKLKSK